jgi:hypothetical protein
VTKPTVFADVPSETKPRHVPLLAVVARRGGTMARSGLKTLRLRTLCILGGWHGGDTGRRGGMSGEGGNERVLAAAAGRRVESRGPARSATAARPGFMHACRALLGMHMRCP